MSENEDKKKPEKRIEKTARMPVRGRLKQRFEKKKESIEKKLTPKKLKLLVTVVNKNKAEFYVDFLQSFEINMQLLTRGEGTANSETRHMLGLEDSERAVIFSLVREDRADAAMDALEEKFRTVRGGKGIAYTVPLSSVVGVAIYSFLSNNRMKREEKK